MDTISAPEDLYKFLKESKIKLVANIMFAGSPGHQVAELDYFLRKYKCGDIPKDGHYLWIQKNGPITATLANVFGDTFRQYNLGMLAHDDYYAMATQICRMVPEFGIDVGLSHVKNSMVSRENTHVSKLHDNIYYNVTNEAVVAATKDYYRTKQLTQDFHPWNAAIPSIEGPLADLLGNAADRFVVIHFRKNAGNAGITVPPEHFYPTFEYLRDCGYAIVKVGTEACPPEFGRYNVIDYTGSPIRSFKNDITLMALAKLAIVNASGLEVISVVTGVPVVSFGQWHLTFGPYNKRSVVVPALLFDPVRQRLLSFAEQILVFKTRWEYWEGPFFGWHFPYERYTPRAPEPDELRASVQEALGLAEAERPFSAEQALFTQLERNGPLSLLPSRVSQFFLERFRTLL